MRWQAAAAFAETLGAPVYQQSAPYGAHFLSEHPCYMGALSRDQKQVRGVLPSYDLMIVLGADPLRMSVWSEVEPLPDGLPVVHIGLVDWDMGKNFAAEIAVQADVRETLLALTPAAQEAGRRRSSASAAKAALAELAKSQLDGQARASSPSASTAASSDEADRSRLAVRCRWPRRCRRTPCW